MEGTHYSSKPFFTTVLGMGLAIAFLAAAHPAGGQCVSNQAANTNASFGIESTQTTSCANSVQGFSFPVTSCNDGVITRTRIRFENAIAGKRFQIYLWRNNANQTPNDNCFAIHSDILTLPASGSVLYQHVWGREAATPNQCFQTTLNERVHIGVTYVDDSGTTMDWEIARQDNASGPNFGYVNYTGAHGGWDDLAGEGYAGDTWGVENVIEDGCIQVPDVAQTTWQWIGNSFKRVCPQGDADEVQVNGTIRNSAGAPIPGYPGEFIGLDCAEIVGYGSGPDSTRSANTDFNGVARIRFNEAGYSSAGECNPVMVEVEGVIFTTLQNNKKIRFFDMNGDGFVDASDLAMLASHMGSDPSDLFADLDNDGVVCSLDADVMALHLGHSGFAPSNAPPEVWGPPAPIDLAWQIDGSGPWTGGGPAPPSWANGLLVQGQGTPAQVVDVGPTMKMVRWNGLVLTGSNAELGDVTITQSTHCGCLTLIESLSPTGVPFYPATQTNYFFCNAPTSTPQRPESGTTTFTNVDPIKLVAQVDDFPSSAVFVQEDPVKLFGPNPDLKIQFNDSELGEPGVTGVGGAPAVARGLRVEPWSPSPFGGTTELRYELAQGAPVTVNIYDAQGRLRRQLLDGAFSAAGSHKLVWDGADDRSQRLPSGRYFYRLDAGVAGRTTGVVTIIR